MVLSTQKTVAATMLANVKTPVKSQVFLETACERHQNVTWHSTGRHAPTCNRQTPETEQAFVVLGVIAFMEILLHYFENRTNVNVCHKDEQPITSSA